MHFFIGLLIKYCNSNPIVVVGARCPIYDLGIAHTLSLHTCGALLIGSQHTYAWRVYGKGTKPYWYHNTAYSMEPYFVSLHFPNLISTLESSLL